MNYHYSSCLSGQYYTLNGCGVNEMCCFSNTQARPVPAILPDQCGLSVPVPSTSGNRIVGGIVAQAGEFPWQVSLRMLGQHMCGGILIDKHWVLSAAHCFRNNHNPFAWTVVVAENDRARLEGQEKIVKVDTLFVHSGFNAQNYSHDIALLKLAEDVHTNAYIRPVCMPNKTDDYEEMTCVITGWGAAYSGGHGTHHLYKANVPVLNHKVCEFLFNPAKIPDTMICAGLKNGGVDTCQGDSGGPLVCQTSGTYKVAGIVSWGYSCAQAYTPGVYTRVTHYIDWIHSVLAAYDSSSTLLPVLGKRDVNRKNYNAKTYH